MVGDSGQTTPAPWLTYTHAGCNVGGVSAANIELENDSVAVGGDVSTVYGANSPEAQEPATQRMADFVGIAIHCAKDNALCATNGKPDQATTVTGSDEGYKALLGAKYVNPAITGGNGCVKATDGTDIKDPTNSLRVPRLRRCPGEEHARRGRPDAGERRARDVRVHLRRARQPRARTRVRPG